jgi:hypothetical protein
MNDWLVMLFLGADNDLFQFGQDLLDEATKVGSSDRIAVVAELDPTTPGAETLRGPLLPGRREMTKIGVTNGDASTILNFVEDSRARYEAHNRALILWDHGNGWQNVHVFDKIVDAVKTVKERHGLHDAAEENEAAEPLFLNDLKTVLDPDRGIGIVGYDACLMSLIEVAFQLRDTAQFMIASQNVVPAARGWAYEALLRTLTMNPRMSAEDLVCAAVDTFAGSYNGSDDPVTLTGLRLSSEVDRAVAAIDSFSQELLDTIALSDAGTDTVDVRSEIVYARRLTQSFGNPDYIDLRSFCDQIQKRLPAVRRLNRMAEYVKSAVDRLVVRHTRSSAASIANANGVSIYFPQTFPGARIAETYANLDFADPFYCRWARFLAAIVEGADAEQQSEHRGMPAAIPAATSATPPTHSAPAPAVAQAHCGCVGCGVPAEPYPAAVSRRKTATR